MSIAFDCVSCGKQFKVSEDMAGRKGRCPKCQTVFRIPDVAASTGRPKEDGFAFGASPATSPFVPTYDEAPARPRKAAQGGSRNWIVPSIVLLLLVGGAGTAYWKLDTLKEMLTAPAGFDSDLRYLPDGAQLVVSVNVDHVLASAAYEKAKDLASQSGFVIRDEHLEVFGKDLTFLDIRRITFGASSAEGAPWIGVLRLKKPLSADEVKNGVKANAAKNHLKTTDFEEVQVGKYTMVENKDTAFCLTGSHTLVLGPSDHLRKILERQKNAELSSPMRLALRKLDFTKSALALAADPSGLKDLPPEILRQTMLAGAAEKQLAELDTVEAFTLQLDLDEGVELAVASFFKDAKTAEAQLKKLEAGLTLLKTLAPPDAKQLAESLTARAEGKTIELRFSIDTEALAKLAMGIMMSATRPTMPPEANATMKPTKKPTVADKPEMDEKPIKKNQVKPDGKEMMKDAPKPKVKAQNEKAMQDKAKE